MDVTRMLRVLRSERQQIEQDIRFLERFDRLGLVPLSQRQSVTEITSAKTPEVLVWRRDDVS
jgi:hypothetical protein